MIYHTGIYKHLSFTHTHTRTQSLLSVTLQSIPPDCPQTFFTVCQAPCCLEPYCLFSWISCATVVFIVPFLSDSWLLCVCVCGESIHIALSAASICAPPQYVFQFWVLNAEVFGLNGQDSITAFR